MRGEGGGGEGEIKNEKERRHMEKEREKKRHREKGEKEEKRFREVGWEKNDKERRERVMSLPLYQRIKPVGWWNSDEGNGTADIYIRGYWWSRDNSRLNPLLLFLFRLLSLVYYFSLFLRSSLLLRLLQLSLSLDWQSAVIGHYILIEREGPQPWVT